MLSAVIMNVVILIVTNNPFNLCVIMLSVLMMIVIMLSVITLSVIMLSVIMLSVIMLSVIMLSVVASKMSCSPSRSHCVKEQCDWKIMSVVKCSNLFLSPPNIRRLYSLVYLARHCLTTSLKNLKLSSLFENGFGPIILSNNK
jgi:hypothetical protein